MIQYTRKNKAVEENENEDLLVLSGHDQEVTQQISQFIKNRRIELGLNQTAISDMIGVDQSHYSKIERGIKMNIQVWTLMRLMNCLDVEVVFKEKRK